MYKFYRKSVLFFRRILNFLILKFFASEGCVKHNKSIPKQFNLSLLLLIIPFLHVFSSSNAQNISINRKNAPLTEVFKDIGKQTDYDFIYTDKQLATAKNVSISVTNASIKSVLDKCFENQPLTYRISEKTITIETKRLVPTDRADNQLKVIDVTGTVIDEAGVPLVGAGVTIKGSSKMLITNNKGEFFLKGVNEDAVLIITYIGYVTREIGAKPKMGEIRLVLSSNELNEVEVNAGYYKVKDKERTGNIIKITSNEIQQVPVSNPLAALAAVVPGLVVTQSSGVPGSAYKLQLRGQNSISQGNDPLIIINGMPFAPNNNPSNQLNSAVGIDGSSPLNTINPFDIESIEILKDADATAIYGSRGANGVILITTKGGKKGPVTFNFNLSTGMAKASRTMEWMDTKQYIAMRKEAFRNDGVSMTVNNAYDIMVWDTTKYSNWKEILIGGVANSTDANFSLSGGSEQLRFGLSTAYRSDGTVFPGDMNVNRKTLNINLGYIDKQSKLHLDFSAGYGLNTSNLSTSDLTPYLRTSPALPAALDSNGELNWLSEGYYFDNPLSHLKKKNKAVAHNLITNFKVNYLFDSALKLGLNFGYNMFFVDENTSNPNIANNPSNNQTGSALFATNRINGFIIEPQINYTKKIVGGDFSALAGISHQQVLTEATSISGTGYKNDALIGSLAGATSILASNNYSEYKYIGFYGRLSYSYSSKFFLNFSGRRDGSSRFGPGKKFANFYAFGSAWIFSDYKIFKQHLDFLKHGKIRASYGITGNDNIGNYQYLDSYRPTTLPYGTIGGIYPTKLANAEYAWETNKKLEFALELALFKNSLAVDLSWFRNRSGNQLLSLSLPSQTGFEQIIANLPALVENTGFEFQINSQLLKIGDFTLRGSFMITRPRNKLVSYPGLETSSFRNTYELGKSLNAVRGYNLEKYVNPQTGVYSYIFANGEVGPSPIYPLDVIRGIAELSPRFYGNFQSSIKFKRLQLNILFDFRKQMGYSYLYTRLSDPMAGMININQPTRILQRWQRPGDLSPIQKFTQTVSSPAYSASRHSVSYGASNLFTDASFIRVKNIYINYDLNMKSFEKRGITNLKIYLQANNMFTISDYYGMDPETQVLRLPPLRSCALGINLTF